MGDYDEALMWKKRLERQLDAGLSDSEYAQALGIDSAALQRWRARLRDGVKVKPKKKDAAPSVQPIRSDTPPRTCRNPRCEKLFTPRQMNAQYCSPRCQRAMCRVRWEQRRMEASRGA